MRTGNYLLASGDYNGTVTCIEFQNRKGYQMKPKNKVSYEGVIVSRITIYHPTSLNKLLKRKAKHKLDSYLDYIIRILEEEEDDGEVIDMVMNNLSRYKRMIINKYRQYLEKEYFELLMKKMELLEHELMKKKFIMEPSVEMKEKSGRRSR